MTERQILLKLFPSKKTASKLISWFVGGAVIDHRTAAKDIATLVEKLKGRSHVVQGLTLMTDRGLRFDIHGSGLSKAVKRAGYRHLN